MKILLVIAALTVGQSAPVLAATCGRIDQLRGDVDVLRIKKGEPEKPESTRMLVPARTRMSLSCSDIVVSGKASRAKLRFFGNAVMTMGPHSRVEVRNYAKEFREKDDPNQLKLTYGKLRALIKKKVPKKLPAKGERPDLGRLVIETPTAVAGVRGTDFYVKFEPNTGLTEQATIEGAVEVEQKGTGQKVLVEKGNQVTVEKVPSADNSPPLDGDKPKPKQMADSQQPKHTEPIPKPKPLRVVPIAAQVVEEIKQTSAIAKNDQAFASPEAVELLGKPERWQPPADELPMDLKDIKEEF